MHHNKAVTSPQIDRIDLMKFLSRFLRHKLILKFTQKGTRPRIAKTTLKKREESVHPT